MTQNRPAVEGCPVRRERDQGAPSEIFLALMRKEERCRSIEAVSRPDLIQNTRRSEASTKFEEAGGGELSRRRTKSSTTGRPPDTSYGQSSP